MKKNIALGAKPKKKSIPININSNPTPGKFIISNPINPIASSYFSMGQKIQISKNNKNSKIIHVNTNSAMNYYTLNSKDSKQINGSITNSLLNNYQSNNVSENNGINFNNFYNNNLSQQHYDSNSIEKNIIKYNNLNINSKGRKHLSTISNSLISNDLLINGYQTSKNNNVNHLINNKSKSKIISTNSKNSISKIRQTYSTRPNFLDSRNKTKKVPMKSKIRQYKYQFKSGKPVSTSFSNVHIIKNNIQGSVPRNIYNYERGDLINNITNENNNDNIFVKHNTNGNYIINNNNNLYENKNKHFRHNTASFDNKDIINIFNKNNLSDKTNKNINNLNIKNVNNAIIKSNNSNICINNIDSNNKNLNINLNRNIISKNNNNLINEHNINKRKHQYSKGKISDIKIYINDKKINQKENKLNQIINNYNNYKNYHSNINNNNNCIKDNYNNNAIHHIKNTRSINMNVPGIKKISVKQKDTKKNYIIPNQNKYNNKPIPNPNQKMKGNIIPSQRNIKINLAKFLEDVKNKQNNKLVMGRKSLSIKRISKENNSDFSLSQLNDKFTQKILKNNEEGNDIGNYATNNKQNINKTIQEDNIRIKKIEEVKNENDKFNEIDNNNILIDTNFISNIQNKSGVGRISSIPTNAINEISQNNANIYSNNINYNKLNYNNNASTTTNNNYYGKKNDYSVDNIPDLTNNNINNQAFLKNKENINDLNINNITDINKTKNVNNKNSLNEKLKIQNNKNNKNNKKQIINNINDNSNDISSENNKNNNFSVDTIITKNNDTKYENNNTNNTKIENKTIHINNNLFDEDNLDDLPEDYDENFNDLYSIINKMNFSNVLVCVEGLFTPEGRTYKKYKEKFDKFYDKLYTKKGNSFANSNNNPKKIMEGISMTSNTKTNSSSSKKNIINPMYNDLNIVKDLNAY